MRTVLVRIRLTWEALEPNNTLKQSTSDCCGEQIDPLQLPVPLNRTAPHNSRGHISAVASTAICLRNNQEYLAIQSRR